MSVTVSKMANDHQNQLQFTANFKPKIGLWIINKAKIFLHSLCSRIPFYTLAWLCQSQLCCYGSERDISHSMDTTHTLNDLLLGKPEDKRHFYICGSGFTRLTILKGMRRVCTSSRQCMTPRGWLRSPCAWHSHPCPTEPWCRSCE